MIRRFTVGALGGALLLGGCTQFVVPVQRAPVPPPVIVAPTVPAPQPVIVPPPGQVEVTPLPPPAGTEPPPFTPPPATTPPPPDGNGVGTIVDITPPEGTTPGIEIAAAPAVSVGQFLGAWTIAAGAETCSLTVTQTVWPGGFRASTRNCVSDDLRAISAWDVRGPDVEIKNAAGEVILRLRLTSASLFSGVLLGSGRAVTVFR